MSLLSRFVNGSFVSSERLMHARELYVPSRPSTEPARAFAYWTERASLQSELACARELAGLPDAELAMGKSQLKGQITLSLESVTSRMYRCAGVELYGEPYRTLDEMLALVDAVTPEQIADVARTFFAPERQTVVSLGPGDDF